MSAGAEPVLTFAGYVLDARKRLLTAPDGRQVNISSRAFDTLLYLAQHAHEVVDKQRLMKAVWPTSVVEENNLNQQISALRRIFGETPSDHRFIVTVTGRGYRFVQDVRPLAEPPAPSGEPPASTVSPGDGHGEPVSERSPQGSAPGAPALRRWRAPRRIAAACAAASVLALIAAGAWVFLGRAEPQSATVSQARSTEARDAYSAARAAINTGGTPRAREAIALLERAVELDPDFALAWAALAEAYTYAADFPADSALPLTELELQQRVSRAALRAFELAPDAPEALRAAGMLSMQNRDWAEAERRLRRAVELAGPDDYDANLHYAWFLMNVGRVSEAIAYGERAMRAEPSLLRPVTFLAALREMRGELDEAEALLAASAGLDGHDAMRREALFMIYLARRDESGLRRLLLETGEPPHALLDDPPALLVELRQRYADAIARGLRQPLLPVAIFAAFLGDEALSLDALRELGPTQNVHVLWRHTLREVRTSPAFADLLYELDLVDYWRASGNWGEFCRETPSGAEITCS